MEDSSGAAGSIRMEWSFAMVVVCVDSALKSQIRRTTRIHWQNGGELDASTKMEQVMKVERRWWRRAAGWGHRCHRHRRRRPKAEVKRSSSSAASGIIVVRRHHSPSPLHHHHTLRLRACIQLTTVLPMSPHTDTHGECPLHSNAARRSRQVFRSPPCYSTTGIFRKAFSSTSF